MRPSGAEGLPGRHRGQSGIDQRLGSRNRVLDTERHTVRRLFAGAPAGRLRLTEFEALAHMRERRRLARVLCGFAIDLRARLLGICGPEAAGLNRRERAFQRRAVFFEEGMCHGSSLSCGIGRLGRSQRPAPPRSLRGADQSLSDQLILSDRTLVSGEPITLLLIERSVNEFMRTRGAGFGRPRRPRCRHTRPSVWNGRTA